MNISRIFFCVIIILTITVTGCITPQTPSPISPHHPGDAGQTPPSSVGEPQLLTPIPPSGSNADVNSSAIPLLFTDDTWKTAQGCGWTKENISKSADLFMDSCRVRTLLEDGWVIDGMSYAIDTLGNRCRRTTHPDAPADCDWCDDAGPTLRLRYNGQMKTELIADMKVGTVMVLSITLPEGTASVSRNGSTSIVFRNGTVLYTFRNC
jgi:hypothetical protein